MRCLFLHVLQWRTFLRSPSGRASFHSCGTIDEMTMRQPGGEARPVSITPRPRMAQFVKASVCRPDDVQKDACIQEENGQSAAISCPTDFVDARHRNYAPDDGSPRSQELPAEGILAGELVGDLGTPAFDLDQPASQRRRFELAPVAVRREDEVEPALSVGREQIARTFVRSLPENLRNFSQRRHSTANRLSPYGLTSIRPAHPASSAHGRRGSAAELLQDGVGTPSIESCAFVLGTMLDRIRRPGLLQAR